MLSRKIILGTIPVLFYLAMTAFYMGGVSLRAETLVKNYQLKSLVSIGTFAEVRGAK